MRYDVKCKAGHKFEVSKGPQDPYPRCRCGLPTARIFSVATPVMYNAAGFYATDYGRFEKQVGAEKAAKFRASKDEIEGRAAKGKLTGYEKAVEAVG